MPSKTKTDKTTENERKEVRRSREEVRGGESEGERRFELRRGFEGKREREGESLIVKEKRGR
eukprot:84112-Amorphochlora_amoeboformis.AAC.1